MGGLVLFFVGGVIKTCYAPVSSQIALQCCREVRAGLCHGPTPRLSGGLSGQQMDAALLPELQSVPDALIASHCDSAHRYV